MAFLKTASVLVLLCITTWLRTTSASGTEAETNDPIGMEELQTLVSSLRAGDYGLVRPSPSRETATQQRILCPDAIPSLVETVCDSKSALEIRGKAAEVLALCTTNNPENRELIGSTTPNSGKSIHSGLVDLIRVGKDIIDTNPPDHHEDQETEEVKIAASAIGNAAEAIWILTFASVLNHGGFVEAGAIPTLASLMLDSQCENRSVCSRPIMWSAAALQNLAASYCSSESGHCWWEWTQDDNEEVLRINPQSPIMIDGQKVREEILKYDNYSLIRKVAQFVCEGPVRSPHHSRDENGNIYAWPSRGAVTSVQGKGDEESSAIVPWAAAGLIKNLALGGPEAREKLLEIDNLESCLCNHARSPDWLEALKAEDALNYLGVEECPPSYSETCQNFEGWKEREFKDNCEDYERENWCVEWGHLQDSEGRTANEACCACGGGENNGTTEL